MFSASGKTYEFLGFRRAYVEGADDPAAEAEDAESAIPPLDEGDAVACDELQAAGHSTQPPARFTEASLVKELEERGIGRPSTYASVIQTITHERGYVWKKGTALVPSWIAFAKLQLMERHFQHLVDYEFTATMEEELDVIARGEGESEKWLHDFYYGNGQVGLKDLVSNDHLLEIDARDVNTIPLGQDDQGRQVNVRVGKYGPYLERGDDTTSIADDIPPDELTLELATELLDRGAEGPTVLGTDPESGLEVVARDGRYGPYVQLGELVDGQEKPKTASLLESMSLDSLTLDDALKVLGAAPDRRRRPRGPRDHRATRVATARTCARARRAAASRRRSRSSPSPSSRPRCCSPSRRRAAVAPSRRWPSWARTPTAAPRCACSTVASGPTPPTARPTPRSRGAPTRSR